MTSAPFLSRTQLIFMKRRQILFWISSLVVLLSIKVVITACGGETFSRPESCPTYTLNKKIEVTTGNLNYCSANYSHVIEYVKTQNWVLVFEIEDHDSDITCNEVHITFKQDLSTSLGYKVQSWAGTYATNPRDYIDAQGYFVLPYPQYGGNDDVTVVARLFPPCDYNYMASFCPALDICYNNMSTPSYYTERTYPARVTGPILAALPPFDLVLSNNVPQCIGYNSEYCNH
jgi:hypothetical protein